MGIRSCFYLVTRGNEVAGCWEFARSSTDFDTHHGIKVGMLVDLLDKYQHIDWSFFLQNVMMWSDSSEEEVPVRQRMDGSWEGREALSGTLPEWDTSSTNTAQVWA